MEVSMKKKFNLPIGILMMLFLATLSFAQFQEEISYPKKSLKPGLGFEYFSRTIEWNGEESSSKLKSYFFTFCAEFELQKGFSLGAFIGYSFSNFDSLIFRKLPFSLELEAGGIGGVILGGEIETSIFYIKGFEIGALGQFVYYLGGKQEWEISGLNVEGTAKGKPYWMRAQIGPTFVYKGFDYFHPYLFLSFNKLWGTFRMEQIIEDLEEEEKKKISGKSLFNISLGAIYEITEALSFKGGANIMPFKNGVDFGLMIKAMYSF